MGSFNVVEAASMGRNQENSDYILSEYEKHRKVRKNFAKISGMCGEKRRGKVEMDRIMKARGLKRECLTILNIW